MQDGAHVEDFRGWRGVGVAADVEVVIVVGNLGQGDDFGVAFDVGIVVEGGDDIVDVLWAQLVLVFAFLKFQFAVDEQHLAFTFCGFVLVDDQQAGGDAGAIE